MLASLGLKSAHVSVFMLKSWIENPYEIGPRLDCRRQLRERLMRQLVWLLTYDRVSLSRKKMPFIRRVLLYKVYCTFKYKAHCAVQEWQSYFSMFDFSIVNCLEKLPESPKTAKIA